MTIHKLSVEYSNKQESAELIGKKIIVNSSWSLERKLFYILHECGHYLMNISSDKSRYNRKCKPIENAYVNLVDEEFEAWNRGKKLAHRLGIKLNQKFDFERCYALRTYFDLALIMEQI